jgi:hypothetical protein
MNYIHSLKMATYQNKLIISGKKVELYQYETPIHVGQKKRKKKIAKRRTKEEIIQQVKESEDKAFDVEVMRDSSLRRTRSRIVRLINANPDLKVFVTLTFEYDVPSLVESNPIFKKFIKRLKRKRPDLKYIAIPEFQSDTDFHGRKKINGGSVHYHLLVNFEMASDELKNIWQNGFVKINRIKHVNHLGLYVSKYVGKNLFDIRYFGMRKILASKNLEQPIIITVFKEVKEFITNAIGNIPPLFEKSYRSDWLGKIQYRLYGF